MRLSHCFWHIDGQVGTWPSSIAEASKNGLSSILRRRMTPLGRQVMELFYMVTSNLNYNIPWVMACRQGDITRRIKLLNSLANQDMLSPTDFSMSVHNALLGVFSIATLNKDMNTALAGGNASFEAGLLEAYALQKDHCGTVGYMYYDSDDSAEEVHCLALVLDESEPQGLEITYHPDPTASVEVNDNKVTSLRTFLNSKDQTYTIPTGGGNFFLARHAQ